MIICTAYHDEQWKIKHFQLDNTDKTLLHLMLVEGLSPTNRPVCYRNVLHICNLTAIMAEAKA